MENQDQNSTASPACSSVGGDSVIKCTKRSENKNTLARIALGFIRREGTRASCSIDSGSGCKYTQEKIDVGNFIRHFRTRHLDLATANGLFKDHEVPIKKQRIVSKRLVAIDKHLLMESLMLMLTVHNVPIRSLQWRGFKQLLDPLAVACGVTVNGANMIANIKDVAQKMREHIAAEVKGRLISLKIDSATRQNRHILGINAQYSINDTIVIRTLEMLEVQERQTARFLKSQILEVAKSYGIGVDQIFSITCDNGANMLAAVRQLKQEMELLISDSNDVNDMETLDTESHEFTAALNTELQENLNLVRCAVHTLQLAILDVVNKSNASVKAVTDIAKKCKQVKYKLSFKTANITYPPVWGPTRWCGIYEMNSSFLTNENFFKQLAQQFPELDLGDTWDFVRNYEQAFKPLYICTKNMQSQHVSLPDFYLQWLMSIMEVSKLAQNPFSAPLREALTSRLQNLRQSRAFRMALYIDPRLNYMGSKLFNLEEKEHIQNYIVETYNRISSYEISAQNVKLEDSLTTQEDDFDSYITEMFGECDAPVTNEASGSRFFQQLKAIEVEPRQNHAYDVWRHWVNRRDTHPELYAVASVVLAVPSNQISVERAFSALPLVMTDRRAAIGEENLRNILLVKLNEELFDSVLFQLYPTP
ncbi:uncharacterized protein LOC134214657 [Armigeres subalbatus]|uniref:uncharacterized protein LOC134214657 n=1 Tax=Armigeres subalbatus TaxID=124917 RepID=UPI002ED39320